MCWWLRFLRHGTILLAVLFGWGAYLVLWTHVFLHSDWKHLSTPFGPYALKTAVCHHTSLFLNCRYYFVASAHIEDPKYVKLAFIYTMVYHKLLERKIILFTRTQTSESGLLVWGNMSFFYCPQITMSTGARQAFNWEALPSLVQLWDLKLVYTLQQKLCPLPFLSSPFLFPHYPEKRLDGGIL